MLRNTNYRFRAYDETYFRAHIPILLVPELAHLPSVRNIHQTMDTPYISLPTPEPPGLNLFRGKGAYVTCHIVAGVDPGGVLGPRLDGIGTHASTRRPGMSAQEYLKEAILDPDAFIHEGCVTPPRDGPCTPCLMAATLDSVHLTDAEVDHLVDFLLTLD